MNHRFVYFTHPGRAFEFYFSFPPTTVFSSRWRDNVLSWDDRNNIPIPSCQKGTAHPIFRIYMIVAEEMPAMEAISSPSVHELTNGRNIVLLEVDLNGSTEQAAMWR